MSEDITSNMIKKKEIGTILGIIASISVIISLIVASQAICEFFKEQWVYISLIIIFLLSSYLFYNRMEAIKDDISNGTLEIKQVVISLISVLPTDVQMNIRATVGEDECNKLFACVLFESLKGMSSFARRGSGYILTDEGEKVLPKELKDMIYEVTRNVKVKSTDDALTLIDNIGRENLIKFSAHTNLTFIKILALSVLYAIKLSKEDE